MAPCESCYVFFSKFLRILPYFRKKKKPCMEMVVAFRNNIPILQIECNERICVRKHEEKPLCLLYVGAMTVSNGG